jgi:hypothetical protein
MKKLILAALLSVGFSYAENTTLPPLPPPDVGPFTGLDMSVGYIQKENGEKLIVVETPEGTKLVKETPKKKKAK